MSIKNTTGFYPSLKEFKGWTCASRDKRIAKIIRERGILLHDFVFFHEWGDSDMATGSWGMVVDTIDAENFKVYWWDDSYIYSPDNFDSDDHITSAHYSNLIPFEITKKKIF